MKYIMGFKDGTVRVKHFFDSRKMDVLLSLSWAMAMSFSMPLGCCMQH